MLGARVVVQVVAGFEVEVVVLIGAVVECNVFSQLFPRCPSFKNLLLNPFFRLFFRCMLIMV